MKTIAFFNNKGGVGKTTSVYHLSWMFAELGFNVLVADLDPQSNLTNMFLEDQRLEEIWGSTIKNSNGDATSIYSALSPIMEGIGDVGTVYLEKITDNLRLIPGDLRLANFEDNLSDAWSKCLDKKAYYFRVTTAFHRIFENALKNFPADLILVDVGPNFGAINRAAMTTIQHIVIPLVPDLFSMQGLKNLGPILRKWREEWASRVAVGHTLDTSISLPDGRMQPLGYILMQYNIRKGRPVKSYQRWIARIPKIYTESVWNHEPSLVPDIAEAENDPHCLSSLKHYLSLMPMAMEARKPMFFLTPADGAIGVHTYAVNDCKKDFKKLAEKILEKLI